MTTRLAVGAVILIWGVNFSVIKAALADFEPLAFNALRFGLASAILLAFFLARREGPRFSRREWLILAALGVLGNVLYQILFILGIDRTRAGNTSLLLETVPILTALMSSAAGHERLSSKVWTGILLSLAGAAVVVAGSARGLGFGRATVNGDLLVLAAAAAWAAYTVAASQLVRRHGTVAVTATTMWIGTAGLFAVGLPSLAAQDWGAVRQAAWAGLVYSGAFAIAGAYLLWYLLVGRIGSTRAAVYTTTIPVVAMAVAWLAIGEVPTTAQAIGAAAIIGGVVLAQRAAAAEMPPE